MGSPGRTGPNNFTSSSQNPFINPATPSNAGTYTVTVTGTNTCMATGTADVTVNPLPVISTRDGNASFLFWRPNGSIQTTVTGGTTPYSYSWTPSSLNGQPNPTGLAAGTYSLTVSDGQSCFANSSTTVTQPAVLTLNCLQQSPVSTPGGNDGSASIAIGGGTAPYTYAWSGASGGSASAASAGIYIISNLVAGSYSLTLTDFGAARRLAAFPSPHPAAPVLPSAPSSRSRSSAAAAWTAPSP
ncbi:MAG: SprB repeat-containing protein [Saprospiraceae bacterium]|nr:SprB repeat-containing protein [Saprospiraceae bacterium]